MNERPRSGMVSVLLTQGFAAPGSVRETKPSREKKKAKPPSHHRTAYFHVRERKKGGEK
jgi:hypothetical protein